MKKVRVLGSGCAKCANTAELIQRIAAQNDVAVELTKDTSPAALLSYGVMSTPAVVVDEQLVHSGSIPDQAKILSWLKA